MAIRTEHVALGQFVLDRAERARIGGGESEVLLTRVAVMKIERGDCAMAASDASESLSCN